VHFARGGCDGDDTRLTVIHKQSHVVTRMHAHGAPELGGYQDAALLVNLHDRSQSIGSYHRRLHIMAIW
jgi:hypothetical protein